MSQATSAATITVYSTTWCPDCHRTKGFLKANGIDFEEIDIEATPETAEIVAAHNNGKHVVPTLEVGGKYYGNPSLAQLPEILGLS